MTRCACVAWDNALKKLGGSIWPARLRIRFILIMSSLAALSLAGAGCGAEAHATKIETQLDAAIRSLTQQSQDWQATLTSLENKLNQDANHTADRILAQVSDLAMNSIASAGGEFRCDSDFIANRITSALRRIKAEFFGGSPPPLLAHLCQVVPSSIKVVDIQSGAVQVLDLHGYDLLKANLRLELVKKDGSTTPVGPGLVGNPTPYEMTLNLSRTNGLAIPSDAQKLLLVSSSSGKSIGDLTIEQPPIVPPPLTPITVQNLTISFHTNDDDKDGDTGLQVTINSGALSAYQQVGDNYFADDSDNSFLMSPSSVDLQTLSEAALSICISPNGDDEWHFDWRLTGTRSDGANYLAEGAGVILNQDNTCLSPVILPHIPPPYAK